MNQSLKTAVYGLAVADALGVPYEFLTRGSFKAIEMVGYGSHTMAPDQAITRDQLAADDLFGQLFHDLLVDRAIPTKLPLHSLSPFLLCCTMIIIQ